MYRNDGALSSATETLPAQDQHQPITGAVAEEGMS